MPQQRCLGTVFAPLASQANRRRPRFMISWSVEVPALKDLLDRPLDLETLELVEAAMRTPGFGGGSWSVWGNACRSLMRHGSSPERVLNLLCVLEESSDEKMHKMDLDDVTVEQVAAARSALREAIGDVELAAKKGEWPTWYQVAPWIWNLSLGSWCLGSEDLPMLRALEARASILTTRLEQEAQKENDAASLQEMASTRLAFCFVDPQIRFWPSAGMKRVSLVVFLNICCCWDLRGKLENEAEWASHSSATIDTGMWALEARRISETGSHVAVATTSGWVRTPEKKARGKWIWALEGRRIQETGACIADAADSVWVR